MDKNVVNLLISRPMKENPDPNYGLRENFARRTRNPRLWSPEYS